MMKSFRFLLQSIWTGLGALIGFAVIVTVGAYATGVPGGLPDGSNSLFQTYFSSFPLMTLLILFMYGLSLCSNYMDLALSMGARRKDFFWAVQGVLLVYTAVGWALQFLMSALPWLDNWADAGRFEIMMTFGGEVSFPMLCLVLSALGCATGPILANSKVWGTIIIVAAILLTMLVLIMMMLLADTELWSILLCSSWGGLWRALPAVLLAVGLVILAASEALIWRAVSRFVVR